MRAGLTCPGWLSLVKYNSYMKVRRRRPGPIHCWRKSHTLEKAHRSWRLGGRQVRQSTEPMSSTGGLRLVGPGFTRPQVSRNGSHNFIVNIDNVINFCKSELLELPQVNKYFDV